MKIAVKSLIALAILIFIVNIGLVPQSRPTAGLDEIVLKAALQTGCSMFVLLGIGYAFKRIIESLQDSHETKASIDS